MKRTRIIGTVFLCATAGLVGAADFDGSEPMLCSTVAVNECLPNGDCERVTANSINAPNFLRVDVDEKTITNADADATRPANVIESSAVMSGKLYLQGKDDGLEGVRDDGLAWSVSINQVTGEMVLTASGSEVAFVIFGACIAI
ncbi:MAG: hypothetical protein ACR2Q3_08770 [Woeseiaceae bacterium]